MDKELIAKGAYFLHQSAQGAELSKYHIEANIAYQLTSKEDSTEKWKTTLQLYDQLLQTAYSPIAALNKTYAFSKVYGKEKAITAAEKLQLTSNHFYFTLLGELYSGINNAKAIMNFERGMELAKTMADKKVILQKIKEL